MGTMNAASYEASIQEGAKRQPSFSFEIIYSGYNYRYKIFSVGTAK